MPRSRGAVELLALHSQADPVEAGSTRPRWSSQRPLCFSLACIPSWQLSQVAASGLAPRLCTASACWEVPRGSRKTLDTCSP